MITPHLPRVMAAARPGDRRGRHRSSRCSACAPGHPHRPRRPRWAPSACCCRWRRGCPCSGAGPTRWPCSVVTTAAFVAYALLLVPVPPYGALVALATLAVRREARAAAAATALLVAACAVAYLPPPGPADDVVPPAVVAVVVGVTAQLVRERRARIEAQARAGGRGGAAADRPGPARRPRPQPRRHRGAVEHRAAGPRRRRAGRRPRRAGRDRVGQPRLDAGGA